MAIVNNEQCVVGDNKHNVVVEVTHSTLSRQTQNTRACVVLRACSLGCARTTHTRHSTRKRRKEKSERKGKKRREQRVVLDGGGARLADAATRHHLTQTTNKKEKRRKENSGEQNKHKRTQTIQKTSTRQGTTNGHHTLPSMRSQTPIHKQRTTQTQQC